MDVKLLRPITPIERMTPFCVAEVTMTGASEIWRKRRVAHAKSEGREPAQCSRRASVEIDGKPYCSIHAGPVFTAKLGKFP